MLLLNNRVSPLKRMRMSQSIRKNVKKSRRIKSKYRSKGWPNLLLRKLRNSQRRKRRRQLSLTAASRKSKKTAPALIWKQEVKAKKYLCTSWKTRKWRPTPLSTAILNRKKLWKFWRCFYQNPRAEWSPRSNWGAWTKTKSLPKSKYPSTCLKNATPWSTSTSWRN